MWAALAWWCAPPDLASAAVRKSARRKGPPPLSAAAAKRGLDKSVLATLSGAEKQWVQRWTRSMNLRDLAAQLVVVPFYGDPPNARSKAFRTFSRDVQELGIGGFVIINRVQNGSVRKAEPHSTAAFLNRMQRLARVPLIVAGDFERGSSMRMLDTAQYPHNMAYTAAGDVAATRRLGAATARESRAMGFHWVLAPDADVNNNPDNPIINIRSYGEDPNAVAQHVRAYIEGARSDPKLPVLVTVKHFPGHGDTATDSHIGLATVAAPRERLNAVEFVPFRAAIDAKVDTVMTAHLAIPAIEPETIPATVSAKVLTDLLRNELKFTGIVVTDAMDMQGLSKQFPAGEASVRALLAGADVLLMPTSAESAIRAVVAAVEEGRVTRRRVEESAARLLAAKVRVGLHRGRLVDLEQIADALDTEEAELDAQAVADRAVTLVKNEGRQAPVNPAETCFVALAESRGGQQGRAFIEELRTRAPKANVQLLDPLASAADVEAALASIAAAGCRKVAVAAFASVASYRGNLALAGEFAPMLERLTGGALPVTLVSLGNPYLIRSFPKAAAYLTTYSPVAPSERAAVKALLGAIPIQGRLPVTLPGVARLGEGIQMPVSAAR
jgi:beta-N-acetylhexosaminidase